MSSEPGPPPAIEAQMIACVNDSLRLYLYDNARFMCERLVAEFPSSANVHLLATCYFRSDQAFRAYHLLQSGARDADSRYLLAQCCLQLGKLPEAEQALSAEHTDGSGVPHGAAGYYLLGRVCRLSNRAKQAVKFFASALALDPLLWCAYEELCILGAEEEASRLLLQVETGLPAAAAPTANVPASPAAARPAAFASSNHNSAAGDATPAAPAQPATALPAQARAGLLDAWATPSPQHGSTFVTPSPGPPMAAPPAISRPHAPARGGGRGARNPTGNGPGPGVPRYAGSAGGGGVSGAGFNIDPSGGGGGRGGSISSGGGGGGATPGGAMGNGQRWKFLDEGKLRKVSGKLFPEPTPPTRRGNRVAPAPADAAGWRAEAAVRATAQQPGPRGASGGAASASASGPGESGGAHSAEGRAALTALLQMLGEGWLLLCMFRCGEAIEAFGRLSAGQYATGWVLSCVGRACFEAVDYPQAARAFEWARQADPTRLEGLEVYSTVLWHLRKEVDLAHLAQEAVALDRRSPYAWVVLGNCFSLQKEHEAALRFFLRALQLDPTLAYAYTLCGHEYFANEDFDKGLQCYRNAIRVDGRHYNAWYGVGQIYFRQEKFEMAEYHFRRSLQINERSSVLRCYLGMALAKVGKAGEALACLGEAIAADRANPLAKFERAGVLLGLERFHDALAELEALRDIAPREASVWFQMGRIYKRLDQPDQALAHFCTALDLKPSAGDVNLIKAAIEKIRVSDESEEEEI
ncbi:hypothetical protein WJX81_006564 [Elliptochloris bilobata]|uniref:Uncharacterized protein n=1 Tax=Elliptochloris bilobata TaxID=381761 RepID=A0AAW1QUL0_9CHLO